MDKFKKKTWETFMFIRIEVQQNLHLINTNDPRPLLDVSVRIPFLKCLKFADFDSESQEQSSRNVKNKITL